MEKFKIETIEDVKEFFETLHNKYELAFHPDDLFEDYVNIATGEPTFTKEESTYLNEVMEKCFEVCNRESVEIYLVGLSVSHPDMLQ